MLIVKIVFWIYVVNFIIWACFLTLDHPRTPKPVNMGTDLLAFLIKGVIAFFLGWYIWY